MAVSEASTIAASAFPVTAAVGDFDEFTARLIEEGIGLGTTFDGGRFSSVGSAGHELARQDPQQVFP